MDDSRYGVRGLQLRLGLPVPVRCEVNSAALMYWPGEVHEGNGTQQVIIDERADPTQREALRKILHGESTAPRATHFFVYNAMMSTVLDTLYASIDLSIDVDQRTASLTIEGLVESRGTPLPSPLSAALANRIRLNTPDGPRYIYAEMGILATAHANLDQFDDAWRCALKADGAKRCEAMRDRVFHIPNFRGYPQAAACDEVLIGRGVAIS
jgi:hypothetical protein